MANLRHQESPNGRNHCSPMSATPFSTVSAKSGHHAWSLHSLAFAGNLILRPAHQFTRTRKQFVRNCRQHGLKRPMHVRLCLSRSRSAGETFCVGAKRRRPTNRLRPSPKPIAAHFVRNTALAGVEHRAEVKIFASERSIVEPQPLIISDMFCNRHTALSKPKIGPVFFRRWTDMVSSSVSSSTSTT